MAKQMFINEMEQKLREFDEKLERLAARPEPRSERGRLERVKTQLHLRASKAELAERLRQAMHTPDESWHEFTDSMRRMYDNMARNVDGSAASDED
jgi:hypothetical protein